MKITIFTHRLGLYHHKHITGHSKVLKSINDFPFRLQRVYSLFCPVLCSVLFFFSSFPIQCIFAKKVVGKKWKFLAKQLMLVSTVCCSMTTLVEHSLAESTECRFLPKIWSRQIFSWLSFGFLICTLISENQGLEK